VRILGNPGPGRQSGRLAECRALGWLDYVKIFDAETVLRPVKLLAEEAKKPHIARQRKVPDRAESGGRVESELSGCSFRERWSATVPQRRYSARQRLTAMVVDKKKRHGLSPVTITHHLIKNP
jgi:hypothetical protein